MPRARGLGAVGAGRTRRAALRDGVLFAAAGVVPALFAVALGLRAVRNEEAAIRREAEIETAAAVQETVAVVLDDVRAGEARLAALRPPQIPAGDEARRDLVAPLVPRWAEIALLDARLEPVVTGTPPPLPARGVPVGEARADPSCRAAAAAVQGGAALDALAGCDGARTELGRWLVPFVLLGVLQERGDDGASEALIAWLTSRGAALHRAEAATSREEIASSRMTEAQKARALVALDRGGSTSSTVTTTLQGEAARAALARGPDARSIVRWEGGGALGVLRLIPEGGAIGFVADATTVGRALAARRAGAGATRLRAVTSERAPGDSPRATRWITPGLGVEATLRYDDLAARTRRSRWGLWAIAGGSAGVALLFAVVLFTRLRAARRTSELRTSFAAAVSHELRTPIASIRMLAELLEDERGGDEDERRETATAIARESRRLGETVSRLLAWSRMSEGKTEVTRTEVVLAEVVGDAVDVFEERNSGVVVDRDLDPALVVAIDPALVQLAVLNLLENARKYAPDGGPYRVVVGSPGDHAGTTARIEVHDRGPGVPRASRSRIFEAFERGDDRLSRATEGTGIGLALVRAVARAHDGEATVDARHGGGASFVITLGGGGAPATARRAARAGGGRG